MNIAVVCRIIDGVGGTTTSILEQTRAFAAGGWTVHIYGEKVDKSRIREVGGIPHSLPGWPWGSYFKRRLFSWVFDRTLPRTKFDLVIGHGDTLSQDILALHNCVHAAHEAVHGGPPPGNSGVARIHARILSEKRFRLLVANSELMKAEVSSRFQVPADMITVIYPGYDPLKFHPDDRRDLSEAIRNELRISKDEIAIGLITSGDFRKRGISILIAAAGRLPAELRSKIKLVVMGKETRIEPYRDEARRAGLADRTLWLPPLPNVERYFHALDVFAYPALYEEFGQSVQEAMACGLPVVVSSRTGASELIHRVDRELMVEKPEEEAFSRRLALIISRPDLRKRMAQAGVAAAAGNTWTKNSDRWKTLIKKYQGHIT